MSERERELTDTIHDDRDVEIIDLDARPSTSSLRSRFSPRQRWTRIIGTTCLIVVVLVVLLGSSPTMRSTALGLLYHPTPLPTPPLQAETGMNQFYVEGVPPWGQLFLDGQAMNIHTDEAVGQPLPITHGHHVLRLQAEPFGPLSCTLSIPVAPTDTCHYTNADMQVSGTWVLTFNESLATLPGVQRAALVQAIQAVLDQQQSTTFVQPGERYIDLGTAGHITTARELLRTTMRFHLLAPLHGDVSCSLTTKETSPTCAAQGSDCAFFCSVPNMNSLPGTSASWQVQVSFRPSFDYMMLDNRTIANDQPDALPNATAAPDLLLLGITWDGSHWHVRIIGPSISSGNPIGCVTTENNASQSLLLQRVNTTLSNTVINSTIFQFVASHTPAEGCLLAVLLLPDNNPAPSPATTAYFLYRFGLYQAANGLAHRLWPQLPQADAYGRSLAQKMAAPIFAP